MPMTVIVPDEIARAAERMARKAGTSANHLVLQALRAHFPPIPDALQVEFDAMERASDEDMAAFERSLENR